MSFHSSLWEQMKQVLSDALLSLPVDGSVYIQISVWLHCPASEKRITLRGGGGAKRLKSVLESVD